jgi:hypothetical protein
LADGFQLSSYFPYLVAGCEPGTLISF